MKLRRHTATSLRRAILSMLSVRDVTTIQITAELLKSGRWTIVGIRDMIDQLASDGVLEVVAGTVHRFTPHDYALMERPKVKRRA